MRVTTTRWTRLERYARWKQQRLRLDLLPCDVLGGVAVHLGYADVCALVNVLYDAPLTSLASASQVRAVPGTVRSLWLRGAARDTLDRALRAFAEPVLCDAQSSCTYAMAHADWSVFTGPLMPRALCTYAWTPQRTAHVHVDAQLVDALVEQCVCERRCSTTLVIHRYFCWSGQTLLHPEPLTRATLVVFPHFLISEF